MSDDVNEKINDYLDKKPASEEERVFRQSLSSDEVKTFDAYKTVDSSLRNIKHEEVRADFTSVVMARISKSLAAGKEQKRFILIIISVFVVLTLFISGFVFSETIQSSASSESKIWQNMADIFITSGKSFSKLIPKGGLSILGSLISFGILITAWFYFDSKKEKA